MQKKILLALIALTFAFAPATAERIKHEDKIIEAITLMDEGKYAPSIRILRDVLATTRQTTMPVMNWAMLTILQATTASRQQSMLRW